MASSAKRKQIKCMEQQDEQGISRKKFRRTLDFNTYAVLKGTLLLLIPAMFFLYSPALVFVVAAYVLLYYGAILTERGMNKSVVKANHIHIPKFDSILAAILILFALVGTILSSFSVSHPSSFGGDSGMMFGGILMDIKQALSNFGSLLTGKRSLTEMAFGTESPPSGGGGGPKSFSLDDLPLQFLFSIIFSIISVVLLCFVIIAGIFSLVYTYVKIRRFSRMMNEVIYDGELKIFSDEELDAILSFGEEEPPPLTDGGGEGGAPPAGNGPPTEEGTT